MFARFYTFSVNRYKYIALNQIAFTNKHVEYEWQFK